LIREEGTGNSIPIGSNLKGKKKDPSIIFIKPVEPFLACYVSKGQSYLAIKKLNKFSESIKTKSEIWEKLNEAIKTSQILDVDSMPLLGNVVNEIFSH
jgi:hypothetical protein